MKNPQDSPQPAEPMKGPNGGPEPAPYRVSDRHAAVRRANRIETAEDYVEAIGDLQAELGEARVRDLAECFGVSHVTVSRTIDRLQRDGLVITEPYRSIELTEAGRSMADTSRERHAIVLGFLLALGVPKASAQLDAEGMEHHVGPATLAAFSSYAQGADGPARRAGSDSDSGSGSGSDSDAGSAHGASPTLRFERVRAAHAIELAEDYVEAIDDLIASRGEARVVDLARHFGVSHVTVSRALGRLQRDGYVKTAPYRPVHLTPIGRSLASRSRERHQIVLAFLLWLGIPARQAEIDAEGVEHHVSLPTLQLFAKLAGAPPPTANT